MNGVWGLRPQRVQGRALAFLSSRIEIELNPLLLAMPTARIVSVLLFLAGLLLVAYNLVEVLGGQRLGLLDFLLQIARAIDLDIGDLYMLLATLSWAVYTWVVRKRRPKVTMAVLLFAQIVSGLMLALPLAAFESIRPAHPLVIDLKTMAMVGYIATCASLIAYFCWDRGVARVGAQLPMFFQNLTPVFAALISSVALHETPELYHLVGLGLILLGIVLASRRAR